MKPSSIILSTCLLLCSAAVKGQSRSGLPDVSSSFKGTLVMPLAIATPLFNSITEPIGQLDAVAQWPIIKGFGVGAGGNITWFSIKERALAPLVTSGEVRLIGGFVKLQYEEYTGPRTFFELSGRVGLRNIVYDCATCPEVKDRTPLYWGVNTGYYVHATDNLAFGLTLGYSMDATRFSAADLGLQSFPGRKETQESGNLGQFVVGLGFSTRFRRTDEGPRGW